MASSVLSSRTIRGITYKSGDSFVCAYSASGNGGSEGNGTSAAPLTVGKTYYFYGYVVSDDSGTTIKYPCKIGSNSSSSSIIGYYPESVFPYAKYTIKYNANGGTGAPSSQTKTHGTNLTLSSTKPTRTGYTFVAWALTKADADNGTWYYKAGSTCGRNENLTLYAVWEENKLTVNYYSNYATSAFADALSTVGADKNVKVWTTEIYYDDDYSTYGLANYSNSSGSVYMTRTGYTATKYWGTSTSGGTLVHEDTGYATGQKLAKALGKDLSSGNASINVYAQWQENTLTVNYYSNFADYGTYQGELLDLSDGNSLVHTQNFLYDNAYNNGLSDVQNVNYLYLTRTGYAPTGYWGTSKDGGKLVNQNTSFSTGQELAVALGKDLSNGNVSIDIYPQWSANTYIITYNANGGFGDVESQSIKLGETFVLSNNTFKREGYKFVGWNSYRNIDDKWYVDGLGWFTLDEIVAKGYRRRIYPNRQELTFDTSWMENNEESRMFTLYAVWEISGVVYIDNGTALEPYLVYIDDGANWNLHLAYIDDGTNWITIS